MKGKGKMEVKENKIEMNYFTFFLILFGIIERDKRKKVVQLISYLSIYFLLLQKQGQKNSFNYQWEDLCFPLKIGAPHDNFNDFYFLFLSFFSFLPNTQQNHFPSTLPSFLFFHPTKHSMAMLIT